MKTSAELYLSRNFVEFGPFTPEELSLFSSRGILFEGDFIKQAGSESWQPCLEWMASVNAKPSPSPAPAPAKKAEAAVKAPAPAKKKTAAKSKA